MYADRTTADILLQKGVEGLNRTSFSIEIFGDHFPWMDSNSSYYSDNSKQLERMKNALRKAMQDELTNCQKRVVEEFYFNSKSITVIAREMCVNKSTVSRHLKRAKEKLRHALKYGLYNIWIS